MSLGQDLKVTWSKVAEVAEVLKADNSVSRHSYLTTTDKHDG
jgi:hypothetical protein